jgi:hypothetical protein
MMTVRNKLLQAGLLALLACGGTGSQGGGGSAAPLTECDDPMPGWVFCSGFEEGSKASWDDYDGNPDSENQLVADPGPWDVAGNHVARLRVPAGRGGSDLVKLLPPHDRLYARWYVAYERGVRPKTSSMVRSVEAWLLTTGCVGAVRAAARGRDAGRFVRIACAAAEGRWATTFARRGANPGERPEIPLEEWLAAVEATEGVRAGDPQVETPTLILAYIAKS